MPPTATTPCDVTLIHRTNAGSASVVRLVKVGRSYWHGLGLWQKEQEEGGGITEGYLTRWEKASYLLIEGQQWELVQQIRRGHFAYQETVKRQAEERDEAKREMVRVWEDRWDLDHPTPRRDSIEEIVARWHKGNTT